MDFQQIAVGIHLIGFALGLGGATISDITFFKVLRSGIFSVEQYSFLRTLSKIIWIGLGLLIVSGLMIFTLIYSENGSLPMLASPRWQAKLTLVAVVLLNGLFFNFGIFPLLKNLIDKPLTIQNVNPCVWKLAFSGTVSILSWYSILIISLLPRTFRPPYLYFIGTYLVLLVAGVVISRISIAALIRKPKM